jgi:hypothetical protein
MPYYLIYYYCIVLIAYYICSSRPLLLLAVAAQHELVNLHESICGILARHRSHYMMYQET